MLTTVFEDLFMVKVSKKVILFLFLDPISTTVHYVLLSHSNKSQEKKESERLKEGPFYKLKS